MNGKKILVEKGIIALVCLAMIFALTNVLARYLNTGFTVLQQVYLRLIVASLLGFVFFYKDLHWRKIFKAPKREWLILLIRSAAAFAVGQTLISKASSLTLIGNVTFISALPFVPLLGFVFLREKVRWWKLLCIGGSLLGVALIALGSSGNLTDWSDGDIFAIIATLGFAFAYVGRKWHGDLLNNQELTVLSFFLGSLLVAGLSLAKGEGLPVTPVSWMFVLGILVGGAMTTAIVFLVNYGFQHVNAVRAGNLLTLETAFGVLFGLVFYGEWPALRSLLGGAVIVASVIIMNIYSKREVAKLAAIQEESNT